MPDGTQSIAHPRTCRLSFSPAISRAIRALAPRYQRLRRFAGGHHRQQLRHFRRLQPGAAQGRLDFRAPTGRATPTSPTTRRGMRCSPRRRRAGSILPISPAASRRWRRLGCAWARAISAAAWCSPTAPSASTIACRSRCISRSGEIRPGYRGAARRGQLRAGVPPVCRRSAVRVFVFTVNAHNVERSWGLRSAARGPARCCRSACSARPSSPPAKLASAAANDDAYFRISSADANLAPAADDLREIAATLEAVAARHPRTVAYSRAYNRWVTDPAGLYRIDPATGWAIHCAARNSARHRHLRADLSSSVSKCCNPNIDCRDCRLYARGKRHRGQPLPPFCSDVQGFLRLVGHRRAMGEAVPCATRPGGDSSTAGISSGGGRLP